MNFKFEEGIDCAGIYLKINFSKLQNSNYVMQILDDILFNINGYETYTREESLQAIYDLIGFENVKFETFCGGKTYIDPDNNKRVILVSIDELTKLPVIESFPFQFVYKLNKLKFKDFKMGNDYELHRLELGKLLTKNKIKIN